MQPFPGLGRDTPLLPTLGQGLVLWVLFLFANNLGGMFAAAIEQSWPGSLWAIALASVLLAAPPLAVVWLGKQLTGRAWIVVLPVRSPPPWASMLVVVSVTRLQLANLGLLVWVAELLPRGESPLAAQLATAPVLKAMLITPLTEEAMFRGLLLGGFLLAYRRWAAILRSAALFAVIHLSLPLLGHAAANGVALALLDLPGLSAPLLLHPVSFGILGLSFLSAGTFHVLRTLRAAPRASLTMGVP